VDDTSIFSERTGTTTIEAAQDPVVIQQPLSFSSPVNYSMHSTSDTTLRRKSAIGSPSIRALKKDFLRSTAKKRVGDGLQRLFTAYDDSDIESLPGSPKNETPVSRHKKGTTWDISLDSDLAENVNVSRRNSYPKVSLIPLRSTEKSSAIHDMPIEKSPIDLTKDNTICNSSTDSQLQSNLQTSPKMKDDLVKTHLIPARLIDGIQPTESPDLSLMSSEVGGFKENIDKNAPANNSFPVEFDTVILQKSSKAVYSGNYFEKERVEENEFTPSKEVLSFSQKSQMTF
jgi:hypothetical protein